MISRRNAAIPAFLLLIIDVLLLFYFWLDVFLIAKKKLLFLAVLYFFPQYLASIHLQKIQTEVPEEEIKRVLLLFRGIIVHRKINFFNKKINAVLYSLNLECISIIAFTKVITRVLLY